MHQDAAMAPARWACGGFRRGCWPSQGAWPAPRAGAYCTCPGNGRGPRRLLKPWPAFGRCPCWLELGCRLQQLGTHHQPVHDPTIGTSNTAANQAGFDRPTACQVACSNPPTLAAAIHGQTTTVNVTT